MNWMAVLIGLISYPILWAVWFFLSPQYEHQSPNTYMIVLSVFYTFMPLVSGFIAAHFAQKKGFLHGLVLGLILTSISTIGWYFLGILTTDMFSSLVGIFLLATIGGALSQGINYLLAKKN